MQSVTLQTVAPDGQRVESAQCVLKNSRGVWEGTTPCVVAVHRSADDLMVDCKKDGMSEGFLRGVSSAAGSMWGNIILGGGIGAIIDHNKGNGYNYPDDLHVEMGNSIVVNRSTTVSRATKETTEIQEARTNSPAR